MDLSRSATAVMKNRDAAAFSQLVGRTIVEAFKPS